VSATDNMSDPKQPRRFEKKKNTVVEYPHSLTSFPV
jgi:hypothetical protein